MDAVPLANQLPVLPHFQPAMPQSRKPNSEWPEVLDQGLRNLSVHPREKLRKLDDERRV